MEEGNFLIRSRIDFEKLPAARPFPACVAKRQINSAPIGFLARSQFKKIKKAVSDEALFREEIYDSGGGRYNVYIYTYTCIYLFIFI